MLCAPPALQDLQFSEAPTEVLPVTRGMNLVFGILILTGIAGDNSARAEDGTSIQTQGKHLSSPASYPLQLYTTLTQSARETSVALCCFSAAHEEFEAENPFTPLTFVSTDPSRALDLHFQSTSKASGQNIPQLLSKGRYSNWE